MIDFTQYKNRKDLEKFCEALFLQVSVLEKDNISLVDQVRHSEVLLRNSSVPSVGAEPCSTEKMILRELARLDDSSKLSSLETEEVKNLKMLVEALITLRKKEPLKDSKPVVKKPFDAKQLLSIAKDE